MHGIFSTLQIVSNSTILQVITTYATLGSDFSKATQATRHGSRFAEQFCPLLSVNWWRVVLDESHTVKCNFDVYVIGKNWERTLRFYLFSQMPLVFIIMCSIDCLFLECLCNLTHFTVDSSPFSFFLG